MEMLNETYRRPNNYRRRPMNRRRLNESSIVSKVKEYSKELEDFAKRKGVLVDELKKGLEELSTGAVNMSKEVAQAAGDGRPRLALGTREPRAVAPLRFGGWAPPHARGGGQGVQCHSRAHPSDRGQGTAQAAPSIAEPQAQGLPRLTMSQSGGCDTAADRRPR